MSSRDFFKNRSKKPRQKGITHRRGNPPRPKYSMGNRKTGNTINKYGHGGITGRGRRDPQGACTQQNCNGRPCRRGEHCKSKMFQGNLSCSCVVNRSDTTYQCRNDHDCRAGWMCRNGQCVQYNETPGYNPGTPGTAGFDCGSLGGNSAACQDAWNFGCTIGSMWDCWCYDPSKGCTDSCNGLFNDPPCQCPPQGLTRDCECC